VRKNQRFLSIALAGVLTILVSAPAVLAGQSSLTPKGDRGKWIIFKDARKNAKSTVQPNVAAVRAKKLLDDNSKQPWKVKWNKHSGLPSDVAGRSAKPYPGSLEQQALSFIEDHRPLFTGIDPNDDQGDITYVFEKTFKKRVFEEYSTDEPEFTIVHLNRFYKGLPVYPGGNALVHIDTDGYVIRAGQRGHRIADCDINSALPVETIEQMIVDAIHPDSLVSTHDVHLVVVPGEDSYLAYYVMAEISFGRAGNSFILILDAHTGELRQTVPMFFGDPIPPPDLPVDKSDTVGIVPQPITPPMRRPDSVSTREFKAEDPHSDDSLKALLERRREETRQRLMDAEQARDSAESPMAKSEKGASSSVGWVLQ
jgi:hypothetical protein